MESLGIYALEEHISKNLIENNRLKEGPVIRVNDDTHWDKPWEKNYYEEGFITSEIEAFGKKRVKKDSIQLGYFKDAKNLFEGFRQDKISPFKVFDCNKMATFFALLDLTGSDHPSQYHNMSFYYNPITSLLEPIGRDGMGFVDLKTNEIPLFGSANSRWYRNWELKLFEDPSFFKLYLAQLSKLSNSNYLDIFFEEIIEEEQRNLFILNKEFAFYNSADEIKKLYANQKLIKKRIKPF